MSGPPARPRIPERGMRLDERLVRDGFAETRARAQAAVLAARVTVDGAVADKPGRRVTPDMRVALVAPAHPYVGRGGIKLAHALDVFGVDVRGVVAVDLGASTGGFTDCLLQRGAAKVYAVDVGRGQLAWRLRHDPRVVVMEETNARNLTPEAIGKPCDLVTMDVSFIGLRLLWGVAARLLRAGGSVVALVKPQFEAGRAAVRRGGVVRDPAVHVRVVTEALDAASRQGLHPSGVTASPVAGPAGNIEYFVYLRRPADERRPDGMAAVTGRVRSDVPAVVEAAHAALGAARGPAAVRRRPPAAERERRRA
jgi:23S rRNA (cytidine1920-2'-O)/16S rRNA (cytidine1409-2'-O)-methyltransferase